MNKQEEALNVMAGAIAGGPLVTTVECRAETPSRSKEWSLYSSLETGQTIWQRWNGYAYEYQTKGAIMI